jgi:hypothetical protein
MTGIHSAYQRSAWMEQTAKQQQQNRHAKQGHLSISLMPSPAMY